MNLDAILKDPAAAFESPNDVLKDQRLSHADKLEILEQWEYDVNEMQVATAENMQGETEVQLGDIHSAIMKLKGE